MSSRAGWSEVDITPSLGLAMGGRGPRFTPGASVLDPLLAQVAVLDPIALGAAGATQPGT